MGLFVSSNLREEATSRRRETRVCERLVVEFLEGIGIECVLQMLESQRVVEDNGVYAMSVKKLIDRLFTMYSPSMPVGVPDARFRRGVAETAVRKVRAATVFMLEAGGLRIKGKGYKRNWEESNREGAEFSLPFVRQSQMWRQWRSRAMI